ncbi:MAG: ferrichrome ABC transporter substrate-binding protein [Rhizobiales bacterium]|nr:ferrichrome ABC transporter substrate-binding protein [Hyphomicrobiales bacterium]
MIRIECGAPGSGRGRRLSRLPLVLLLTIGMLFSLMHCAGCGAAFADTGGIPAVASNIHHGAAPDHPASPALCHSGHCLSHVTAAPGWAAIELAEPLPTAPRDGEAQVPASFAGLGLFKPPRV